MIIVNEEELSQKLLNLNENGFEPVLVGHQNGGHPFLAYGWAPGGDGWDEGFVEDDTHSSEFDYSDGTKRCGDCGAFSRRPISLLRYPLTVFLP